MVKTWMWIVGVIAIVVVIIVVIIVMTSSTSSTPSTPPTPPSSLTITWTTVGNIVLLEPYLPENGVFMLTSETSLESYNVGFSDMMSTISPDGFTVKYIYEITGDYPDSTRFDASKVVFIKYVDSTGANQFALILIMPDMTAIIYTADDVSTSIDPTTYNGNWLSTNSGPNTGLSPLTNEKLNITTTL